MGDGTKEKEETSQVENEISSEDDQISEFERDCMFGFYQEDSAHEVPPRVGPILVEQVFRNLLRRSV